MTRTSQAHHKRSQKHVRGILSQPWPPGVFVTRERALSAPVALSRLFGIARSRPVSFDSVVTGHETSIYSLGRVQGGKAVVCGKAA